MTSELMKFDIDRPSLFQWLIIILVSILLNAVWIYVVGLTGLIATFLIAVIASWFWSKAGFIILSKSVVGEFNSFNTRYNRQIKPETKPSSSGFLGKIILKLVGFNLSTEKEYYLEAEVKDVKIGSFKNIFSLRLTDVISSSLGLSLLTATLLRIVLDFFLIAYEPMDLFIFIFFLVAISPLFVFWIVPVIWVFEDSQLRTTDQKEGINSRELVTNIRGGVLSRFLGFGGIIAGLSYLSELANDITGTNLSLLDQYFFALILLLFLLLSGTGTAYLVTAIYLVFYHENNVNQFRRSISDFVPIGVTVVKIELKQPSKSDLRTDYRRKTEYSVISTVKPQSFCMYCGTPRKTNQRFCEKCGVDYGRKTEYSAISTTKPQNFCLYCGTPKKTNQRFCERCGVEFNRQ